MKRALLLVLIMLTTPAWSAPACWPVPPMHFEAGQFPASIAGDPYYIIWGPCQDGQYSAATGSFSEAFNAAMQFSTNPSGAATTWATAFSSAVPLNVAQNNYLHTIMVRKFGAAPVAIDTKAYKQTQAVGSVSYVLIGTVSFGTAGVVGSMNDEGYCRIDRDAVTYPSKSSVKPLVAWAKCG